MFAAIDHRPADTEEAEMTAAASPTGPLGRHAAAVRAMGSRFVADVLAAGERQLWRAPRTAALIAGWPGDAAADALAMRFHAALHALARRGADAALAALFHDAAGDVDRAVGAAMAAHDAFIADWMRHVPQTNEVGRTGAIMAALMVLTTRRALPVALRELGASAGLNLLLARYAYDLGGVAAGDPASPVRVAPRWTGTAPPAAPVTIASARGVDLRPLDVRDDEACERLMAHVWADEPARAQRLEAALRIARADPPQLARGDIADWLPAQLGQPQPAGEWRVVVHSMALQYCDARARAAVDHAFATAGARADAARPLARIGFEWTAARDAVHLSLTTWPDGVTEHLATCHAYGAWVDWHGGR
jgi:hypothetical protein